MAGAILYKPVFDELSYSWLISRKTWCTQDFRRETLTIRLVVKLVITVEPCYKAARILTASKTLYQLCETLSIHSLNQMRETPTFAHLSSVFKSDGRPLSILRLFGNRENARKLGLLGLSASGLYMKAGLDFTLVLCKNSGKECSLPRGKKSGFCRVARKRVG